MDQKMKFSVEFVLSEPPVQALGPEECVIKRQIVVPSES